MTSVVKPKLISLKRVRRAGGPDVKTMLWRIRDGKYPNAVKHEGHWCLNAEDAVSVVAEWREKKHRIPLAVAARRCGLNHTSLNQHVKSGRIKAFNVEKRWFISREELARLMDYYRGTVSTSVAARRLGYVHRRSVHDLIGRGDLECVRLGTECRIRVKDITAFRRLREQEQET